MKPITAEWVGKAEGDATQMEREGRARKNPVLDGICFHAQQCAEKYLKARLCEGGIEFGKTHDLVTLLDSVVTLEPSWDTFRRDLAYLIRLRRGVPIPGRVCNPGPGQGRHPPLPPVPTRCPPGTGSGRVRGRAHPATALWLRRVARAVRASQSGVVSAASGLAAALHVVAF